MARRSYSIFLLFLICWLGHAQQLPFRTFTSRDGLPRSEVRTLCQDSLGFIWCGTFNGFSRFDGASFVNYEVPGGLGADAVNALVPAAGGNLWVATNGGGLSRWDKGSIRRFPVNAADPQSQANRVNAVCGLGFGGLLVGTDRGAYSFDGDRFQPFRPETITPTCAVENLFRDRSGTIWAGTSSGLFAITDSAGLPCRRRELPGSPHVVAAAVDSEGAIWFATESGLLLVRGGIYAADPLRAEELPPPLRSPVLKNARTLLVDRQGALWIGTDEDGLFMYSGGRLTSYTTANGLPANRILSLMEDCESDLWVATNAGLCMLGTRRILNYTLPGKLAHSYVGAITQDRSGHFWFGTPYGLACLDGDRFTEYTSSNGLFSSYVLSLLADRTGTVWVGTPSGLNRITGRRFIRDRWNPARPEENTVVRSFFQDSNGTVWVGWQKGFAAFGKSGTTDFSLPDTLVNTLVVTLCRGPGDALWIGTQGEGLLRYSVGSDGSGRPTGRLCAAYGRKEGLPDENIRSLFADREGTLWIGTRYGGAARLLFSGDSISRIVNYGAAEGLSGDWVTSILQDRSGDLWFGTNKGVDRLSAAGKMLPVRLNATHDMSGDEAQALFEDRDGEIWVGAASGVTRYSPGEDRQGAIPPPVYLQRFQVLGLDDSLSLAKGGADLGYTQHSVSFEYIGPSFREEGAVRYRYMLEGMDADWSPPTVRRYVTYAHLPPGNFTFKVAARAGESPWSTRPAEFSIAIAAPFWSRPVFIGGVIVCLLAAGFGISRSRLRRLAAMERVRNRIAADLHDDIGSTLSSISVFARLAEQELGAGAPAVATTIRRIETNAQTVMESLDDIVWMIRPGNDSLDVIMSRIREYATGVCEARGIRFSLSMPAGLQEMTMSLEDRRQLYLIIKEAVNNIVKHSSCSSAGIAIAAYKKELRVTIQDDGQGFDSTARLRGHGISNMRERALAMGGNLTIESGTETGTVINLRTRIT